MAVCDVTKAAAKLWDVYSSIGFSHEPKNEALAPEAANRGLNKLLVVFFRDVFRSF